MAAATTATRTSGRLQDAANATGDLLPESALAPPKLRKKVLPIDQLASMIRLFATMIKASVPVGDIFKALLRETSARQVDFQTIVKDMSEAIQNGMSLSQAFARHPRNFSVAFVNIVKAGEVSGELAQMLGAQAAFMEEERDLRKTVRGAMIYPAGMCFMMFIVLNFALFVILPGLEGTFMEIEPLLPITTKWGIALSQYGRANPAVLFGGFFGVVGLAVVALKTPAVTKTIEKILLASPGIGAIMFRYALVRTIKTLGALLTAGVPADRSLIITAKVAGLASMQKAWDQILDDVQAGASIGKAMDTSGVFPATIVQVVIAGEEAGQAGPLVLQMSDWLTTDLKDRIRALVGLVEPMMICMVGVFVAVLVFSLMVPIFKMAQGVEM